MSRQLSLLACSLALVLAACSPAEGPPTPHVGEQLFLHNGCTACHGIDGAGGPLGPPLRALEGKWSRAELAEYIQDPEPFRRSKQHLVELAPSFKARMPPTQHLEHSELELLADYLLGL